MAAYTEKRTEGTVLSVKKQWWLKVNTKAVRLGPLDGARFPHIVTVEYMACKEKIKKSKWIGASVDPPRVGERVVICYREDKPSKFRIL